MSDKLDTRLAAFAYLAPSPYVRDIMGELRLRFMDIARHLDRKIPECREKSLAFTALEEASMWVMKALSLTDPDGKVVSP